MNILIADDHPVVRQGLKNILNSLFPAAAIYQAGDFSSLVEGMRKNDIHLLICDTNMSGCKPSVLTDTIRIFRDRIKILLFSAGKEEASVLRYIKAGAKGYLNKEAQEEEIKVAILSVWKGNRYISDHAAEMLKESVSDTYKASSLNTLSGRELEVAHLLCQGLGLLEISNTMKLKVSTVSTYKIRLYGKLNISNVIDLVGIMA